MYGARGRSVHLRLRRGGSAEEEDPRDGWILPQRRALRLTRPTSRTGCASIPTASVHASSVLVHLWTARTTAGQTENARTRIAAGVAARDARRTEQQNKKDTQQQARDERASDKTSQKKRIQQARSKRLAARVILRVAAVAGKVPAVAGSCFPAVALLNHSPFGRRDLKERKQRHRHVVKPLREHGRPRKGCPAAARARRPALTHLVRSRHGGG